MQESPAEVCPRRMQAPQSGGSGPGAPVLSALQLQVQLQQEQPAHQPGLLRQPHREAPPCTAALRHGWRPAVLHTRLLGRQGGLLSGCLLHAAELLHPHASAAAAVLLRCAGGSCAVDGAACWREGARRGLDPVWDEGPQQQGVMHSHATTNRTKWRAVNIGRTASNMDKQHPVIASKRTSSPHAHPRLQWG